MQKKIGRIRNMFSPKFPQIYLLFNFLFSFTLGSVQECRSSYGEIARLLEVDNNSKILSLPLFAYSGKHINDAGKYRLCKSLVNCSYATMIIVNKTSSQGEFILGFCGPANCTAADYLDQTVWTAMIPIIRKASEFYNYNLSKIFVDYMPVAMDPTEEYGLSFPIIMLASLLLVCVMLTIGASIKKSISKNRLAQNKTSNDTNSLDNQHPDVTRSLVSKIFDAWAIQTNWRKLFEQKNKNPAYDSTLDIFNAIRVLTALWVHTIHVFSFSTMFAGNYQVLSKFGYELLKDIIYLFYYCVDPFFFLGGFLATFSLVSKLTTTKPSLLNYLVCLRHRVLRILPSYAVVIFYSLMLPYIVSDSPLRIFQLDLAKNCKNNWWKNLIFLDNWLNPSPDNHFYCAMNGWYLSNDMQIYLLLPVIVWIYLRKRSYGFGMVFALLMGSILLGIHFSYYGVYEWTYAAIKPGWVRYIYLNTGMRIPPYLIGVAAGLLYYEYKSGSKQLAYFAEQVRSSRLIRSGFEIVGITTCALIMWLFLVLLRDESIVPMWTATLFKSSNRTAFAVGLTFLVLPSLIRSQTLLKRIFMAKFWVPFSELSFNFYLINIVAVFALTYGNDNTVIISGFELLKLWCKIGGVSLISSILLYLAVETPFMELDKLLSKDQNMKQKKKLH